jgi:hypothetical protein
MTSRFPLILTLAACQLWACGPQNDLDGTWETPCALGPGAQLKSKTQLVYANLKLTGTYKDYADEACTVQLGQSVWTGTATVGAAVGASGAKKLDLSFASYRYTPLTDAAAATNNQYMYCGISDWKANTERDVLGSSCFGFTIPVSGRSLDLYLVSGSTLKFGKDSKISAAPQEADRPTALDDSRVFTRVSQ